MTAPEIALLLTALGGGAGISQLYQIIQGLRNGTPRRVRVESTAISQLIAERDAARESEREAWVRADAMELRYDRMTSSRNRWRERSHLQDIWVSEHCSKPGIEYPSRIEEDE